MENQFERHNSMIEGQNLLSSNPGQLTTFHSFPGHSFSQITTNRQLHKPEQAEEQPERDGTGSKITPRTQSKTSFDNKPNSIQAKYKNILREHSSLQQTLELKLKELKLAHMQLKHQDLQIKQQTYENDKLFKQVQNDHNPNSQNQKENKESPKCDHFHILRMASNKLSLLSSLITSSFNLISVLNSSKEIQNFCASIKQRIHFVQNLIENSEKDDQEQMDLIVYANKSKLENRETKSQFKGVIACCQEIINSLKTKERQQENISLDGVEARSMQKKMNQYKEQIQKMKENMELFKENVNLLKNQNRELDAKLKETQNNGPQENKQISELFQQLRQDNESMAKELKRIEGLNKTLKNKVLKYKSRALEQDGTIKGLNSAMKQQVGLLNQRQKSMEKIVSRLSDNNSGRSKKTLKSQRKSVSPPIRPQPDANGQVKRTKSMARQSGAKTAQNQIESQKFTNTKSTQNLLTSSQTNQNSSHAFMIHRPIENYGTTQNTQRCPQENLIPHSQQNQKLAARRHTVDNSNKQNMRINKLNSTNQISNKDSIDRRDLMTQFLHNHSIDEYESQKPPVGRVNYSTTQLNQSSHLVQRPKSQMLLENYASPKTARFSSFHNKQAVKQSGNDLIQSQEGTLRQHEIQNQLRSQSVCLHLNPSDSRERLNHSKVSRENIKANTKHIKGEIQNIDQELAALQGTMMQNLNQTNIIPQQSQFQQTQALLNQSNPYSNATEIPANPTLQLTQSSKIHQEEPPMVIEELQPVQNQLNKQLQRSGTLFSRQPKVIECNRGGSFSARDNRSNNFVHDMKTNVESQQQLIVQFNELQLDSENLSHIKSVDSLENTTAQVEQLPYPYSSVQNVTQQNLQGTQEDSYQLGYATGGYMRTSPYQQMSIVENK